MEPERKVDHEIDFDFTKLPPSQWGDYLLTVTINDSDLDALAKKIEVLKPKVRDMLSLYSKDDDEETKRTVLFIHLLVSLGLAIHFENEIEHRLKVAFDNIEGLIADENDLYTISIMFRVFRTYGHNMSSDVFRRFKEDDGKFSRCLIEDFKGMLSFYEALHFRTTTDNILDEALSFTLSHLEPIAIGQLASPAHISRLIQKALHIPQRRNIEALVAREYISFYEQEENHNDTLLKLAKLNFKFLQLHYFKELQTITMWWRELDHTLNFPAKFRERTIENWLSALMMYFEPQFSLGRIMSVKLYLAITFLDDACDSYASVEEVMNLVDCIERWDPHYMGKLQVHMKTAFKLVMCVYKEYEDVLSSQGRLFVMEEMIEEFKIIVRENVQFVKWARGDCIPSFDEYIKSGGAEIGSYATISSTIMGLGEIAKKEDFKWLRSRPKVVQVLAAKARLMDDITDFEEDIAKGYTANALNYYIKQYGVTKDEAIKEFYKMITDINKIVNEECLKTSHISRRVLTQIINFGRLVDGLYTSDDVFNNREGMLKEYIKTLLVDPIHL
ncbi:Alpha-barbatene synthase [Raphanus sativus]|uniref:Alpha-barbatene synthase-like n=1 Tax=Raphanus sativus TaxID=3726 RepID=A0A6J0JT93_RAPSA|nr:alpha-barbatene synthase-like [Raphanus sativus]KAJ4888481.1 Alpha-barbatene synthase [Raphanus sativus]